MADLRQSTAYAQYIHSLGWIVETIDGTNVFIRKLWIFGAIAKIQRFDNLDFERLSVLKKKYKIWMTKFEPNLKFEIRNLKNDSWPLLATKTIRIELNKITPKKDCRYCIRKANYKNIEINNFDEFYAIWKKAYKIKKLYLPSRKEYQSIINALGKNAVCLTIDNIAGAVILIHDKTAYYYYAAYLPEAKEKYLPYLTVWKLMQEAKKRGCKFWDFEGIYDERWPNKDWKGFSHFKKSFGGTEISFPGSFTQRGWW